MQEPGLTEIIAFICISAILGQYPVFFTSWASLGLTVESACSLMSARSQVLFSLAIVISTAMNIVCVCMCVCMCVCAHARTHTQSLSHVQLFATPWTVVCQSPLSMRLSQQEYWSGLHFLLQGVSPPPRGFPSSKGFPLLLGVKPTSLVSPALAGRFFTTEPPGTVNIETKYVFELWFSLAICPRVGLLDQMVALFSVF